TLHPWILKKFLERCREQSSRRQIFITTHSPLVVAESKPEELYLMERQDGISRIGRAIDREADLSKIINEDFLDLGKYWLSGGIGAVPDVPIVEEADLFGQPPKGK
ncbi:MAG: AAA family ATPase, partial [Verrucomicrobiota bacterium]